MLLILIAQIRHAMSCHVMSHTDTCTHRDTYKHISKCNKKIQNDAEK